MKKRTAQHGFVALMSIVIMSAIVLVMIFTLGASVFFSRFSALESEYKRTSLALAEACANTAMLKVAQNASYSPAPGGECVSVSDTCGVSGATKTCRICSVGVSSGVYTILARSVHKGSYTTIEAKGTMGSTNFNVTSWKEMNAYAGPACTLP
jgi:Tfp pilus assembly protein PilX